MPPKLGQHFLKDKRALERIAKLSTEKNPAAILEIGPGHGELTRKLLTANIPVTAIEFDAHLARGLSASLGNPGHLQVITGDVRAILADTVNKLPQPLHIIGNLPYYLSNFLFRQLATLNNPPTRCVFLVQYEVAERASAKEGRMNKLAASLLWWSTPKMDIVVPSRSFSPPPKVDSAVLVLDSHPRQAKKEDYFQIVRALFAQPRKTILNNLASGLSLPKSEVEKISSAINISPTLRPQDLSYNNILELARIIQT